MTQLFKCPGCGGPVSPAANACPRCGQSIAGIADQQQPASPAQPAQPAQPVVAPTVPMPAINEPPPSAPVPAAPAAEPAPVAPAPATPAPSPTPGVDPAAVMTAQPPRKRRRIGLIIGLSVGIPVGVILLLVIGGAILGAVAYGEAEEAAMYGMVEAEQQMTASMELIVLQTAAETYRLQSPGACPTYGDLVTSGHVTPDINGSDPWGWPYVIDCSAGVVSTYSVGPDGTAGTLDDIRM